MCKIDSDAWQTISRNAPFRFVRWCIILGLVIWRWAAGAPSGATGWWPVLFLAVVLVLPDAVGFSLAGSGIQLRDVVEKAATDAETAKAIAVAFKSLIDAGEGKGEAAADTAKAEAASEPPAAADDLRGEFLG